MTTRGYLGYRGVISIVKGKSRDSLLKINCINGTTFRRRKGDVKRERGKKLRIRFGVTNK